MKNLNYLMDNKFNALKELEDFTRKVAQEGIVVLENKRNVLPIQNIEVAVFGRIQMSYYNSGTGSGGLVNTKNIPTILDALLDSPLITINEKLKNIYTNWVDDNPFDEGNGQWASEPWSQKEMPLEESLVKEISQETDTALIIIGRTAGEDRDHFNGPGSYQLTELELLMIKNVTTHFKKTVVILNVGNTIDTSFIQDYPIDGLVYAFAGGINGANALVDVLTGLVAPSGKLPNTIAKNIEDYPSNNQFGRHKKTFYEEDIYVGYRYFETFKKDKVLYPFGYGLTYSAFEFSLENETRNGTKIDLSINIKNVGDYFGKEVVQVYLEQPNGLLGKPKYVLVAFSKTRVLSPSEEQNIKIGFDFKNFASYDDSGKVHINSYVLEKGIYKVHMGKSLDNLTKVQEFKIEEDILVEKLKETSRPREPFKRFVNIAGTLSYEDVPLKTFKTNDILKNDSDAGWEITNNKYNALDIKKNKITTKDFVKTLTNVELSEIIRGEGMSSPKVTPGTAAAFGGVTNSLLDKGIPIMSAADGPSGIRMDSGMYATSLPSGVSLAATFNLNLVEALYVLEGIEMRNYNIDLLLAPGMNINRHPLNGRNFEYFSEDPLLSGMMGASVIRGLRSVGVSGSLKHLVANNQETDRFDVDAIISERALREIYLKGFEIAVKAGANVIMTAYNPINGLWAASNYEIIKMIVRDEWNFDGILITDWWAKMNNEDEEATRHNTRAMIQSRNDIYMVVDNSQNNSQNDNTLASLEDESLRISHLQEAAVNIVNYSLTTPAFYRKHNLDFKLSEYTSELEFNYEQKLIISDFVLNIKINNKVVNTKKHLYSYLIMDKEINKVETNYPYYLSKDKKNLIVLVIEKELLYHFKIKKDDSTRIVNYKTSPLMIINPGPWIDNNVNFLNYVHKTDFISISSGEVSTETRDQHFTFAIEIIEESKYVFEFKVAVSTSELAQVPFSIFVDDIHKSTLTLRDTKGETVVVKAFIIIEKGIHHITYRFNKSGITLKDVNILRHG